MIKPFSTSPFVLLWALLSAGPVLAASARFVELEPSPLLEVDPAVGSWQARGEASFAATDHPLRPSVLSGDGVRLSVELPGAGTLTMRPLAVSVGERSLPPGPAEKTAVEGNRLVVAETWLGVDEKFGLRTGELKHDLLVSRAALETLGAGVLRASWRLELPKQVSARLEPGAGLVLRAAGGRFLARVPPPLVADAVESHGAEASAWLEWDGDSLGVLVDAAWLADPARRFPLRIDPSISLFPAFNSRTGFVDDRGNKRDGGIDSGSLSDIGFGEDVRGFAEFDTSPIPDSATILDVVLEVYLSNHDNPDNPAVPLPMEVKAVDERASASADVLFDAIPEFGEEPIYASELVARTGSRFCPEAFAFRRYDLGPLADGELEAKLPLNWFTIGFVSETVDDDDFDHVDYIGFPESVSNPDCPTSRIPGSRIRLLVQYSDDLPPQCDPGGPYTAGCPDGLVLLDGRGSSDPEGEPLEFSWTTDCPGVIENADLAVASLLMDEPCSADCSVTLTVSDGVNEVSCVEPVRLADELPPVLTGLPADTVATCDDIPPVETPGASDDCDPMPLVRFLGEGRLAGDCPDRYTLIRRWQAVDRCGRLSSIGEQRIEVRDDEPPVLEGVPPDATVSCDDIPPVATPIPRDDCDPTPTLSFLGGVREPGICPDFYFIRRRWQATDRCGNASPIAEQRLTVVDDVAPIFDAVPADEEVSCDAVPPVPSLTATDDCDPAPLVEFLGEDREDGTCPDSYQLTRRWRAVDRCGNVAPVVRQVVTVRDEAPPQLSGVPADQRAACDAVPPVANPSAWDDCDPAPIVEYLGESREDGACPDSYTLRRRWLARDRCGNESVIAEQQIAVRDRLAPVLAGVPADMAVSCDGIPSLASPSATDDCDPAPVVEYLGETREDGPCADTYTLRRRWLARDRCGNESAIEEQVISVSDEEMPALSGLPADTTVSCDAVPPVASPSAAGDCDPAPSVEYLGETREDGACPDSYTLRRRWQARDRCGNVSAIEEQVVTVSDGEPPMLSSVPADVTVSCDAVPPVGTPDASDDCDPNPAVEYLGEAREEGACPDDYTLRRSWQARDRCGNISAVAEQVIRVRDDQPPLLVGVPADATVECDAVPPPPVVMATDNCDPAPATGFTETRIDGSCPGEYSLTRTWSAVDRCGHASTQSQVLNVVDTTPPVISSVGDGDLACIWPPNHRYVCFDLDAFEVEVSDACSEPVTLELVGCDSNQPDDARESDPGSDYNGDGHTTDDCLVIDGGQRVCVRAERAGKGPDVQDGRRYALTVVAVDACGNRSEPTLLGSVHVPHDQSPAADCVDSTKQGIKGKDLAR